MTGLADVGNEKNIFKTVCSNLVKEKCVILVIFSEY